jgi:ABC-type lipoprotein export system ATPase subunit
MGTILKTELLKKYYGTGENQVRALDGIDLSIEDGEFIAVVGTSGSGKSTLLHMLGGLDRPTSGKVYVDGKDIFSLKDDALCVFRRRKIGFVFQDFNLMDSLSVKENIMLPVLLDKKEQKECEEKAEALEKQFGIEHLQEKNPYELSGGERQRVAICRALINDPSIIFADEPTGNLDSKSGKVVAEEFRKINEELGKTLLMVTHDPQMASRCKRVIFLKDGYVMNDVRKEGTEEEFYRTIIGEMEKF